MADRFLVDVTIPQVVNTLTTPTNGQIKLYSKTNQFTYLNALGVEHVLNQNKISSIGGTIPSSVEATDNSVAYKFNNELRADFRTGGVDFYANASNTYSFRFRDADGSNYAGIRAPQIVSADYFFVLPSAAGATGKALTVGALTGNLQPLEYSDIVNTFNGRSGVVVPQQADYDAFFTTPAEAAAAAPVQSVSAGTNGVTVTPTTGNVVVDGQKSIYNSAGLIPASTKVKMWVGQVTSNAQGVFTVDWSSAGFTAAPFNVQVTGISPNTATIQDRVWATMVTGFTATSGTGYTLRGEALGLGGVTIRVAPNTVVHVVAWGF